MESPFHIVNPTPTLQVIFIGSIKFTGLRTKSESRSTLCGHAFPDSIGGPDHKQCEFMAFPKFVRCFYPTTIAKPFRLNPRSPLSRNAP